MNIEDFRRPVLQWSGGKDSMACLYLLREHWGRLIVAWVNTGDAFPETLQLAEKVEGLVGKFVEIQTDKEEQNGRRGFAVDALPINNTAYGDYIAGGGRPLMQLSTECCMVNISLPLMRTTRELGADLVIRGTKLSDARKSHYRNGDVIEGMTLWHPIEGWTDRQVFEYLRDVGGDILPSYEYMATGLDCQHCVGFLDEAGGRFRYTREAHPDLYRKNTERLRCVAAAVAAVTVPMQAILDGGD